MLIPSAPAFDPPTGEHSLRRDERSHERLRWRCRRGMLENDLILTRFLDGRGDRLDDNEVAALDRLLRLSDGELWDVLCGRADLDDTELLPTIDSLRAIRIECR